MELREYTKGPFENGKLFFHSKTILEWLEGKIPVPVTLELDLTLVCNDRCPNCTYGFAHNSRWLGIDQVRCLLEEASAIGVQGLTLTGGGDPLMHPDIADIVDLVASYNFDAGIYTNGGPINSLAMAEKLLSTFSWLRISLDCASEEHFVRLRGHSNFSRKVASLRYLSMARKKVGVNPCTVGISFLTDKFNSEDILTATKTAKDLEFDYIQFKPLIQWNEENHHLSLIYRQDAVLAKIEEARVYETNRFHIYSCEDKYNSNDSISSFDYSGYYSAWFTISIGPNVTGEIRPTMYLDCNSKYFKETTIGEFDRLSDILTSEERKAVIACTTSDVLCVPSDRHAHNNNLLEKLLIEHKKNPVSETFIKGYMPTHIVSPASV